MEEYEVYGVFWVIPYALHSESRNLNYHVRLYFFYIMPEDVEHSYRIRSFKGTFPPAARPQRGIKGVTVMSVPTAGSGSNRDSKKMILYCSPITEQR